MSQNVLGMTALLILPPGHYCDWIKVLLGRFMRNPSMFEESCLSLWWICLFGLGKLWLTWSPGMWSGESFLSVTFKWTNGILLLLSIHPAVYHPSLLVLYKGQRQPPIYRDTLPPGITLPQRVGIVKSWRHPRKAPSNVWKRRKKKRGKANSAASTQQQVRRVTAGISCSTFAHLLSKLKGSFMVIPKNLKTGWSFARCETNSYELKSHNCRHFFSVTQHAGFEEFKKCSCLIASSILAAGTQHEAPPPHPRSVSPFTLINRRPSLCLQHRQKYLAALNDTAISLASFALACAAMETNWY